MTGTTRSPFAAARSRSDGASGACRSPQRPQHADVVCAVEESRSPFLLDFIGDSQRWGRDSSAPSASSRWGQLPPGDGSFVPTEDASSRRQLAHCGHFLVPAASSSRRRLLPRAGGHFLALAASSSRRRPLPRASGRFLLHPHPPCLWLHPLLSGYISAPVNSSLASPATLYLARVSGYINASTTTSSLPRLDLCFTGCNHPAQATSSGKVKNGECSYKAGREEVLQDSLIKDRK
nr:uncharacterized protein LOC127329663 [Lolium perenne]